MPDPNMRRPQLAGAWYPSTPEDIDELIASWKTYIEDGQAPEGRAVAAIVPHAGWVFSGGLAAKTMWRAARSLGPDGPEVVAVLGGHMRPGDSPWSFSEDQWATPLGPLALAGELNSRLAGPLAAKLWQGPTNDNTIEVQLPLVKLFFPKARLWPLRVATGQGAVALGRLLAGLSQEAPLLVLASTDLTHYGRAYGFAPGGIGPDGEAFRQKNDQAFIDAALALDPELMMSLGDRARAACSAGAAAAAASMASILGAKAQLVDYYASSDIQPSDQSVGYAGILYTL